ncbi:VanZ family protein [Microlunatus antarcticus]
MSSCPTANETRNAVSVSWATAGVVPRSAASSGRPGMYMSVASGEIPVTRASGTSGASSRPPVRGARTTSVVPTRATVLERSSGVRRVARVVQSRGARAAGGEETRMSSTVLPAVIAVIASLFVALALLVPFVAVQYRRRGTLGLGPTVLSFAALVYALALVSYTLLPLPELTADFCSVHRVSPQLRPGQFVADVLRENRGGVFGLATNRALQQVVFNVALFVPLGMFLRHLLRRGIVVSTAIGLGVSLLVELTQLTGVWTLFPCAYRLFDVDDLIANTSGALLGALLGPVLRLVPGQRTGDPDEPRPVTARRRLLGMLCDWAAGVGTGGVLAVGWSVLAATLDVDLPARADRLVPVVLTGLVPGLLLALLVLRTGRTLGELVVRLRPTSTAGATSGRGARLLRWALGIGGYLVLRSAGIPLLDLAATALAVASVVAVLVGAGRGGFAYRVVHWQLEDDRTGADHPRPRQPSA